MTFNHNALPAQIHSLKEVRNTLGIINSCVL